MNMKLGKLTALAAALGSAGYGGVAVAQQGAALEEVVVTARRYEESITDAPLAVAVMDSDFLRTSRVDSIQDILELTPGATWGQFAKAQPSLTLRGINGGNNGNASLESAVQVVADGIPLTKAFMMTVPTYDLERVEIMRGPQGTTFGRNATLGLMHFVSARPSQEFDAGIDVSAGTLDLIGSTGFISGSLTDTVSGRVAFNYQDTDGTMEDADTGEALESSENFSIRGSLLIEPSDTFSAYLKAEFITDDEMPTVRGGNECVEPWLHVTNFGGYTDPCDPWQGRQDPSREWSLTRDMAFLAAELVWDVGDLSITSLTGYQDGEHHSIQDAFGTPFAIRDQIVTNDASVISTELRIDNFASGNRVRWLGGISYLEDSEDRIEENVQYPERSTCAGRPTDCAEWNLFTDATGDTSSLGVFGEINMDLTDRMTLSVGGRYSDDTRDYRFSTYGWGEANGLAALGLGNGARDCNANRVPDPNGTPSTVCGTEQNTMGFDDNISNSWDDFSGKVSLSYAINDNSNIYALYSEGFKAGGYQQDARNSAHLLDNIVGPEGAENFELGWKGAYDNFIFAATIFQMEQTDAQVNNNVPAGPGSSGNVTLLVNTGGVKNTGIEFEATWAATDNLTFGGSIASYDAEYGAGSFQGGSFDPVTGEFAGEDISGTPPNNAPDLTYFVYGDYQWALSGGSSIRLRADLMHRSDMWSQAGAQNRDGLNLAGDNFMYLRPELDKIGVNLSWTSASDNMTISLWGRNLDDDPDYINYGPGIGSIFNKGQSGPLGLGGVASRPSGTTGRAQAGVTASFRF